MFNAAVVEDCKEEREQLVEFIGRCSENFSVSVFPSAVDFLTDYKPIYDLVFMDIDMPWLDGMSAAHKLRELDEGVCLVFVTNLARFAVQGYEVSAFDFIVKPFSYEDFRLKMVRIERNLSASRNSGSILVRSGSNMVRISLEELMYVEVMDHKIIYHLTNRQVTSYGTLSKAEEGIGDALFVRCNKCYLVNLRFVTSVEGNYAIVGGEKLLISYPRRPEFLQKLSDYLCG